MIQKRLRPGQSLFGTESATRLLLLIYALKSSYASQLANITGYGVTTVKNQILNLEDDGIISIQTVGRQRMISLNPQFYARKELDQLLESMIQNSPEILQSAAKIRSRPRKTGKEI